jgi:hypothetical protein
MTQHSNIPEEYDFQSQLYEVKLLLDHIFTWRNELSGRMSEAWHDFSHAEEGTLECALANSKWDSLAHGSCYRVAACSQAAVGAVAPLIENLLVVIFKQRQLRYKGTPGSHHRWKLNLSDFWNPHKVSERGDLKQGDDIVRGTMQLTAALEMKAEFPSEFESVIKALFTYRNRILHYGYEWPAEECSNFMNLAANEKWLPWLDFASYANGQLWIISIKDEFVRKCLEMVDGLLRLAR